MSDELRNSKVGVSWVNNGPVSITAYCCSSIIMTIVNKFVVNLKNFNMNFVMLFVQCLVCCLLLVVLKGMNYAKFRNLNKQDVKKWLPINFLLVAMIYTGSKSLQFLPVPIYTIFKNLTIILIAYGEVLFFGGKVTSMELGSFLLMVLSSVVATIGDNQAKQGLAKRLVEKATSAAVTKAAEPAFNIGYLWMLANCVSSALFVLVMRMRIKLTNFKDFDTMFYNNAVALPILLLASFILEDWSPENIQLNLTKESVTAMVVSGMFSVGISYCSGWCVRVTSSTTYSMVGALNKLPIALAGMIFFDAPKNFLSILSIIIGFLAGIVYTQAKQKKAKEQKPVETKLPSSNKD
ncbi:GDP-mannose transporter 1 [Hanseniaspora guilliermondii]